MADYSFSSELFFEELLNLTNGIVWKNHEKALEYEVSVDMVYVEQYILSRQRRLTFDLVEQFSEDVLRSLGLSSREVVSCMDNRNNIPVNLRSEAVNRQMEYNIKNYNEPNNYYRMLNGLPNIEEGPDKWFYNTEYSDISEPDVPIHTLDISQLNALESKGFISQLIENNPTKKYLKHLTDRKIDIYTARQSEPFAILWIPESKYTLLVQDFLDTYNQCRYMISNVFYSRQLKRNNSEYVGFIGMLILFQTILQMHNKFLDTDITRDFYDEDSLRQVYDSYDVPFFTAIPMEFHRKIVKNINILLSHKGSTKVFYDLFDIFGLDNTSVFEFYMMKVHRFKDGKPVFYYNEDGSLNKEEMYEIKFGKVELYNDPTNEMQQSKNQVRYEDLIQNDPYWINDKDLLNKIYSEEFNYMESKYMGIQTTFNLMKILYETTYYLKLILDNRELLNQTSIYNSSTHSNVNIFDLVIYICALITRKHGYEGNIPTDIHVIGKVMGFNFKQDLVTLKENITENDYLKNDEDLLKYLETMNVDSLSSVSKVYTNLTNLRKYLVTKMADTDSEDVYWAYYELYQLIMYSEYADSTFQKSDGTTATSFSDLLEDISPSLYALYSGLDEDSYDEEISDALYLLKSSCNSLKYIQYSDTITIDTLIEYLFKLLEFFKSAKADLTGYEIVYSLISSADNVLKFVNVISHIYDDHTSDPLYSPFDELTDIIWLTKERMGLKSKYQLLLETHSEWSSTMLWDAIDHLEVQIQMLKECATVVTMMPLMIDEIKVQEIFLLEPDNLNLTDSLTLLKDEIMEILKYVLEDNHEFFDEIVRISDVSNDMNFSDRIRFIVSLVIREYSEYKSQYTHKDSFGEIKEIFLSDETQYILDDIIDTFRERVYTSLTSIMEVDISDIEEFFDTQTFAYQLLSDQLTEKSIYYLYKDIKDNYVKYVDEVLQKVFKAYIDEPLIMEETLTAIEKYEPQDSKYAFFDYFDTCTDSGKYSSGLSFQDQLILLKSEVFED